MKNWWNRQWTRFKSWALGILVALGLITGVVLAAHDFTYVAATEREDGTPLALSEIAETRLYCGGVVVASEAGADGGFSGVLNTPGTYDCYATHVDTGGLESQPSNIVQKTWLSTSPPAAPTLDPEKVL